jgi:hypothetical protein
MNKPTDQFNDALIDAMGYFVYRGVVVEKLVGGYRLLNHIVKTKPEADKVIDGIYWSLEKSIKR